MAEIKDWNVAAASNNAAPPDGWPEGMNYSDVNNVGRENMATLARLYQDTNGVLVSGGVGNTYAITTNRTLGSIADVGYFAFVADKPNTGAISIDLGIASAEGVRPSGESFAAGEIVADGTYLCYYNSALTKFVVVSELSATETRRGVSRFATNAEAQAGTATDIAVTPAGAKALLDNVTQSLTVKGHIILNGGLIVQWGQVTTDDTYSFDIPFTTELFAITFGSSGNDGVPRYIASTLLNFDYSSANVADTAADYIAIGY